MSLGIWGEDPTSQPDLGSGLWSFNITHNLGPLWRWAGCYEALYESAGRPAAEIVPTMESALARLRAHPNVSKNFDAPNGWGTYAQALPWLEKVIAARKRHPRSVVRVSR